jgi:general stress protein YciG
MASSSNPNGTRSGRGFASMDPQRQREIASQGGRAAHLSGNAHEFTSEEARRAGQKSRGGQARKSQDLSQSGQSVQPSERSSASSSSEGSGSFDSLRDGSGDT